MSSCMLPTSVGEFVYCITVYKLFASIDNKIYTIPSHFVLDSLLLFTLGKEYTSLKIYLLYRLVVATMNQKCMSERTIDTLTSKNVQMVYTYALCTHTFVAKKRRMKMLEIRAKTLAFQNWAVGASDQSVWCYCCKLFCYRTAKTLVEPGLLV